jgi:hypothetical protein
MREIRIDGRMLAAGCAFAGMLSATAPAAAATVTGSARGQPDGSTVGTGAEATARPGSDRAEPGPAPVSPR